MNMRRTLIVLDVRKRYGKNAITEDIRPISTKCTSVQFEPCHTKLAHARQRSSNPK